MCYSVEEIDYKINALIKYKNNMNFTDDRLVHQINGEIERLELEKSDIINGTHNYELMILAGELKYYQEMFISKDKLNREYAEKKIKAIKDQIEQLAYLDSQKNINVR